MKHTFVRFGLVGLFNTLFNLLLLNILIFKAGLGPGWANFAAVTISICLSFVLNSKLVFGSFSSRAVTHTFALFVGVTLFCQYIVQQLAFLFAINALEDIFKNIYADIPPSGFIRELSEEFYLINTAKIIAVGITVLTTYYLYRKVVFPTNANEKAPEQD